MKATRESFRLSQAVGQRALRRVEDHASSLRRHLQKQTMQFPSSLKQSEMRLAARTVLLAQRLPSCGGNTALALRAND